MLPKTNNVGANGSNMQKLKGEVAKCPHTQTKNVCDHCHSNDTPLAEI